MARVTKQQEEQASIVIGLLNFSKVKFFGPKADNDQQEKAKEANKYLEALENPMRIYYSGTHKVFYFVD